MSIHERLGNKIKTLKEKRKSGFTLPELVVTILIIAILFVIVVAGSSIWIAKGKEAGVETDLHTFYVGAKSAILVGDEEALSSKDNFIDLMNEYLDPQMQVQSDYVTTAKDDPWKQTYEFRWNSREGADGRTEYWLAFISEGVGSRPGWVFEPDKPVPDNEKQYYIPSEYRTETLATRAANNTKEWRYIELLGYYGNGSLIDSMTDPDNNGIEDDIKWVITGDSSVTEWAYLSFYVDEDDIEVDADEVSNDTYVSEINNNKTPGGVGGSGVDRRGSIGIIRDVLRESKPAESKPAESKPSTSTSVVYEGSVQQEQASSNPEVDKTPSQPSESSNSGQVNSAFGDAEVGISGDITYGGQHITIH